MRINSLLLLLMLLLLFVISCTETPRRDLTAEERTSDMMWLMSKFEHNYAPREYKGKLHGYTYADVKAEYLAKAQKEQTNEEFFRLLHSFLAKFQDAHTSGSYSLPNLPNRSFVSYLGFTGKRQGDNFIVQKIMPTIVAHSYPIKVGDVITALDGEKLTSLIDQKLTQYRNLGNKQSNYTALMKNLFSIDHSSFEEPDSAEATLTVKRSDEEYVVKLPWIKKDLYSFRQDTMAATKQANWELLNSLPNYVNNKYFSKNIFLNILKSSQTKEDILYDIDTKINTLGISDSFELIMTNTLYDILNTVEAFAAKEKEASSMKENFDRDFSNLDTIKLEAKTYPTYIISVDKEDDKVNVGYLRIDTFSPFESDDVVVDEVRESLETFSKFGVKKVIIDTINNGGGSLELGNTLAQLFSDKKIELPKLQVKPNENWLDKIERNSISRYVSDSIRVLSEQVFESVMNDFSEGKLISSPISSESIFPIVLDNPDTFSKVEKFDIVLMVNEMCASMCDIFAGIMQDNKLAKVFGTQTMGAGGNVVSHYSAPNSGFQIRLTESLIVRTNGNYLENNGVMPDKEYKTYEDSSSKYNNSLSEAIKYLLE